MSGDTGTPGREDPDGLLAPGLDRDCSTLTAERFLKAMESRNHERLKEFIFLVSEASPPYGNPQQAFLSHYGDDTKNLLIYPFKKMMEDLHGYDLFIDCDPKRYGNVKEVLARSLWSCPVLLFFVSKNFHKSPWCLWELYTATYRQRHDPSVKIHLFYYGTTTGDFKRNDAYKNLSLTNSFGTEYDPTFMTKEAFFVDNVYKVVRRLIENNHNAKLAEREARLKAWRKHCPLKSEIGEDFSPSDPAEITDSQREDFFVPDPLPYFQGREAEMAELSTLLNTGKSVTVFPHGIGGIGKTQLVISWVHKNKTKYRAVVWLRAERELTLVKDLKRYGLRSQGMVESAEENDEQLAQRTLTVIEDRSHALPYLLVFDNADSFASVEKWLPRDGSSCHAIVTTRNKEGFGPSSLLAIGRLDEESSLRIVEHFMCKVIERSTNSAGDERTQVLDVLRSFDFLPLASVAFGSLIGDCGLAKAVQSIKDAPMKSLSDDLPLGTSFGGDNRKSVWAVLSAQIHSLTQVSQNLLAYLSVLNADRVPLSLLENLMGEDVDITIPIKELRRRAIITFDGSSSMVNVHRLLQLAAWRELDLQTSERQEFFYAVAAELVRNLESMDRSAGLNEEIAIVLSHAVAVCQRTWSKDDMPFLGDLYSEVGTTYYNIGQHEASVGKYETSVQFFERSLTFQQAFRKDNPLTATTLSNLASVHKENGQYEKSLGCYKQALAIQTKLHGPNHPDVELTLANVALIYFTLGKYDDAECFYVRAVAVSTECFGPDHRNTGNRWNSLGFVRSHLGKYGEALESYERANSVLKKYDQTDVARTLNNIGDVYSRQGRYDEALGLYTQALEGSFGLDRASTLNSMAGVHEGLGQYREALKLYEQALSITETFLEPNHPDMATVLNNIALVHYRQGSYDRALEIYNRALSIRTKSYGNDHPATATTLGNIASVYRSQGRYADALSLFKVVYTMESAIFGSSHPNAATTLTNMASLHNELGQYEESLKLHETVLDIERASLGNDHPRVATTLRYMADVYKNQEKFETALDLYKRALAIEKLTFGSEHPSVALTRNKIGLLYTRQGQHDAAIDEHEQALSIQTKFLGRDHPDRAITLNNMATAYALQGQFPEALGLYEEALIIQSTRLDEGHPDVTATREHVANVRKAMSQNG